MGAWARRRTSGPAVLVLALPLLGVARLLSAHGFGLWLRLVAATLLLFLPGALVARALRLRGASVSVVRFRITPTTSRDARAASLRVSAV